MFKKLLGLTTASVLALGLAACGSEDATTEETPAEGGAETSASVGEQVDYTIVGIDPGAGLMNITINDVLPEYGLEDDWTVIESSGAAMAASLADDVEGTISRNCFSLLWRPNYSFQSPYICLSFSITRTANLSMKIQ